MDISKILDSTPLPYFLPLWSLLSIKDIFLFRYVDRFIQPNDVISEECKEHLMAKPVFLPRSVRSYNLSPYGKARSAEAMLGHLKNPNIQENHVEDKLNGGSKNKDTTDEERYAR